MKSNITNTLSVIFLTLFFIFTVNAQDNSGKNQDKPVEIKSKPRISKSVIGKCLSDQRNATVKVRLRVTFHSSGEITELQIVEPSGCEFLDKEALRVAKKIKFNPEIKNGEAVTVSKNLEYAASVR